MRILYIGYKYDYGKIERGFSFEHYNFYDSLVKMENGRHQVIYFSVDEVLNDLGEKEMNNKLLNIIAIEKPDLCFFFLFGDEIYPGTIKKITDSGIITFNWFADDHWRWPIYSRYYAPNFSWVSTTDSQAPKKYHNIGYKNVIKTQWACNHFSYHPNARELSVNFKYNASFVGQPHGNRRQIIDRLGRFGVKVDCFGGGWLMGRVSQEKMLYIFEHSKININLTKSSFNPKDILKIFLYKKNNRISLSSIWDWPYNISALRGKMREQIKGRNFEILGTGGFLLTGPADNLSDYYVNDKEVVIANNIYEMMDKAKYYLEHDNEREIIRLAGFERTVREHTYEKRFQEIFKIMGF